jgi:hypothetical protein
VLIIAFLFDLFSLFYVVVMSECVGRGNAQLLCEYVRYLSSIECAARNSVITEVLFFLF